MSKRQFKSHASSGRAGATSTAFGGSGFGTSQSSVLSYVQEPSDYSALSDANVVVAFKNLSKKDETTKAKAVEDLQSYITSADFDIEEGFLEAWTRVFPRLSIENSRRVRQLTHVLNGEVCTKSGKRVAKYMPRITGPWLAGTFDSDRTVSRAASDALNLVFPSADKVRGLRKAFQRSILEYCRDATLHETTKTLSDERIVSQDDAEATYARVVATSLSVVGNFIADPDADLVQKESALYEEILDGRKLWEFVYHADVGVRRTTHKLVLACLDKRSDLVQANLKIVSSAYVYKGLNSDQTGSAHDFTQTLDSLTVAFPSIWTNDYTGKKPPISRLRHFLRQGSQSSPSGYWESLRELYTNLPAQILPESADDIGDLLVSARNGVSRKEERFNAFSAWSAFFTLADVVTLRLDDADAQAALSEHVLPVISQYVTPSSETTSWSIVGARTAATVAKITIAAKAFPLIVREWHILSERLIELARISQPEQSKDFDKSQLHVASTGERWSNLQRELWTSASDETLAETFVRTSSNVLEACTGLLKSRNGKPYGAAAIIEQLVRTCGQYLMQAEPFRGTYTSFAQEDMPNLMFSKSQKHLVDSTYSIGPEPMFSGIFTRLLIGILDASQPLEAKISAFQTIFTAKMPADAIQSTREMPQLQSFLSQQLPLIANGVASELFSNLLNLGLLSPESIDAILAKQMDILTTSNEVGTTLEAMEVLTRTNSDVIQTFASKPGGSGENLLPLLLELEQSPDDKVAEKATSLSSKVSSNIFGAPSRTKYASILHHLEQVSKQSLPLESVQELASRLLGPNPSIEDASDVLPSFHVWLSALQGAIKAPKLSLTLMSPLGGIVYLSQASALSQHPAEFDAEGLSQAFRIAAYVARLCATTNLLQQLGEEATELLVLLHISVLVAEDNIAVLGSNDIWSVRGGSESEVAGLEFTSEARNVIKTAWQPAGRDLTRDTSAIYFDIQQTVKRLQQSTSVDSPMSYYISLSFVETLLNLFAVHGSSAEQINESEAAIKNLRHEKQTMRLIEYLVGFQQPLSGTSSITRLCNELVADLTDIDMAAHEELGLDRLIVLNTILRTQDTIVSEIAKQRLIFLVKRVMSWLTSNILPAIQVEACKALVALLPSMRDIYGEHWEQILAFITQYWLIPTTNFEESAITEIDILLMNATLRLYATLRKLSTADEPNDDLVDALKESADRIQDGLINVLTCADGISDETHQPLMVTHELLARQLSSLPRKPIKNAEELYLLMYTPSRPLVQAAFDLLHSDVPVAQEQASFNAALDNKTAHLPDELLSLILESPTLDSLVDARFDRMMPLQLQGYLFSWRLLFDYFNGSSYRVKNDYIEQLKEGAYLDGLLNLVFDFLGLTRGKPVDVSKFDIENYLADNESTPEKDVQWLLTHLYYLSLTHLPSLVKAYYLNIRSRQTSASIEGWTAKHISPLIIEASLRGVAEWSEKSVKEDPEYEKMTVKVGMRSKEINVNYVVDEQTMSIKVVLPDAYPLVSAQVLGVSRVAVKEEKWQSWLRNCQGVITFSNGSIIDGLTAWRKNVTGALKGQTECAICYSIISADKQLPTKRCPTCKNLFHSSCLLKWFKTSNASTCPLCRNPFQFA